VDATIETETKLRDRHKKRTLSWVQQDTARYNKKNPQTLDTTGLAATSGDKIRERKTIAGDLVRMRSPVQIWVAAPRKVLKS